MSPTPKTDRMILPCFEKIGGSTRKSTKRKGAKKRGVKGSLGGYRWNDEGTGWDGVEID